MANYTTAHVGGPVDAMLILHTAAELENAALRMWEMNLSFILIGAGSNVLVSDTGIRGVVLVNRARNVKIDVHSSQPSVWAESGANLSGIARQVALRGLKGLEWAATIPGTLGGAVYGNAGAHGGDVQSSLILADILHRTQGKGSWPVEKLEYAYRSSTLKRHPGEAVVLSARFRLEVDDPDSVQARMDDFSGSRRQTQPPGASMGSMFKNPAGDHAGRLIDAAGLKGTRIGGAEISTIHANFFVNNGHAAASDIDQLIALAQHKVYEKFGVQLELEIEKLGDW